MRDTDVDEAYRALVANRKACSLCPELENASTIEGGRYDGDRIGPYTRWQGRRDADLLVVAQDFADVDTFLALEGWPGSRVATNVNLAELLRAAGRPARTPDPGHPDDVVFATNAVLCMKRGGMQAKVGRASFETCGREFLAATIELVAPRAVVALGAGALTAIRAAYGVPDRASVRTLVERTPAAWLGPSTALFVRYHPSPTVVNTHRSMVEQREDWRRIGRWLDHGVEGPVPA